MARKVEERRIGEYTYIVRTFGALEGGPVLLRLLRVVGAGLEGFADVLKAGGSNIDQAERAKSFLSDRSSAEAEKVGARPTGDENAAGTAILKALSATLRALDPKEVFALVEIFARYSDVRLPDGRQPTLIDVLDEHFAGEYDAMFSWLTFAIEVNYLGFFTAKLAQVTRGVGVQAPKP